MSVGKLRFRPASRSDPLPMRTADAKLVRGVLDHLFADLLATSAFFRTLLHRRIARVVLARFAASGTGYSARFANLVRKRTLAGNNARRCRAEGRAILASRERLEVFLLTLRKQVGAVLGAHVADALAIVAFLSTLFVFACSVMFSAGLLGAAALLGGKIHEANEQQTTTENAGSQAHGTVLRRGLGKRDWVLGQRMLCRVVRTSFGP